MSVDFEARAQIDKHEAICAERYAAIMVLLKENKEETASLKKIAVLGIGGLRMLLYIGSAVVGLSAIYRMLKDSI